MLTLKLNLTVIFFFYGLNCSMDQNISENRASSWIRLQRPIFHSFYFIFQEFRGLFEYKAWHVININIKTRFVHRYINLCRKSGQIPLIALISTNRCSKFTRIKLKDNRQTKLVYTFLIDTDMKQALQYNPLSI